MYSNYYLIKTLRSKTWFVIGAFKSEGNIAFARTIDPKNSILEFFVTKENEELFLKMANHFKEKGYILEITKHENRLINKNT